MPMTGGWTAHSLMLVVCLLAPTALQAQGADASADCVACHLQMGVERLTGPAESFPSDVHAQQGFGCTDCHVRDQGSPDPHAGFGRAPARRDVPAMCGRCHSDAQFMRQFDPSIRVDQVTEYYISGHGERLLEADDPDVATCNSCHPAHQILPRSDPESTVHPLNVAATCGSCHADEQLMAGRAIGTGQVSDYLGSVHGQMLMEAGDLAAPTCNDCHGNHGAAPPGLASIRNVCGECHVTMADYFVESGHTVMFDAMGFPGCETCHGNHAVEPASDALLLVFAGEICVQCHGEEDPRGHSFEQMAILLDSLNYLAARSRDVLHEAEDRGMEVGQALFELEEVSSVLHRARGAVHAFRVDPVREAAEEGFGLALAGLTRGEEALAEHRFRTLGLGLFALIVFLLTGALIFKIRSMDARLETLVGSVASFYESSLAIPMGVPTGDELRLGACALLIEAAYADDSFSERERAHITDQVRWHFGLAATQAEELVRLVEQQREGLGGVGKIASKIAQQFSHEQKIVLVTELWGLVYSDGELAKREVSFLEDVAQMLGLDADEVAAARRTVAVSE